MLDRYDQDLLLDYLEGELDADRRAQLDAMLADDPQLASLLSEMASDRAALRSLPQAQAPADLVHDVTQTLERRMLLDDSVDENGPIPISRGRGLPTEPTQGVRWGRIAGLTGLAASVAIAAGIVVISLENDPLGRTADHIAGATSEEAEDEAAETFAAADPTADEAEAVAESALGGAGSPAITRTPSPADNDALPAPDPTGTPWEGLTAPLAEGLDRPDGHPGAITPDTPIPGIDTIPPADDAELALRSDALGRAIVLTSVQPRQQLVLVTEEPEVSKEQLLAFCVANGIPIVQPDNNTLYEQRREANTPEDEARGGGDAPGFFATAGDNDYALLIDERQLNQLVVSFNNDVNIQPDRAAKGALFSNQAAVVTDLPSSKLELEPLPDAVEEAAEETQLLYGQANAATYGDVNSKQPIQLRLPQDLGSDYANTRNEYNLNLKQNRSAYRATPQRDADADEQFAEQLEGAYQRAAVARSKVDDNNIAGQGQDAIDDPRESANRGIDLEVEPEAQAGVEADGVADSPELNQTPKNAEPTPPIMVDATRGNWLTQHLPLAHTTQLLDWRTEAAASKPQLIPVAIKQAPAEKVNNLRIRQQSFYGTRDLQKDKPADAASEEADSATGDVADIEVDAAEATPEAQPAPESEPAE